MKYKYSLFFGIAAGVVALDQITKWLISTRLALHQTVVVIEGFFNLVNVHNTGVAFGMLSSARIPYRIIFFLIVSAVAMSIILIFLRKLKAGQTGWVAGLALVFGGAGGNLIDRIRLGEVIDFMDCYIGQFHWPAFNAADSAVTVGAVYLMFRIVRGS